MRILQLDTLADLAAHRRDWEALFDRCPQPSPAQSYAWTSAYLRYALAPAERWICLLAFDQEQLVGALPLMRGQRWGLRRAGVQHFKGLFDPFHTVEADALIAPGADAVLPALLRHLRRSFRALPAVVLLRVPAADEEKPRAGSGCRAGASCVERLADQEAFIPLAADHATYQDRLRAKFRREIKRQERRLKEQAPVVYRLRENTASNLANLQCFAEIEDSGWKGAEGTSIQSHAQDLALFAQATEAFDERGWMEWGFLNAGDETIAAHLAVLIDRRLFLWKVAYREDYAAYAPSNLLLYRLIESLAERPEVEQLNFMNNRDWLRPFRPESRARLDRFLLPPVPGVAIGLRAMLLLKRQLEQWGRS